MNRQFLFIILLSLFSCNLNKKKTCEDITKEKLPFKTIEINIGPHTGEDKYELYDFEKVKKFLTRVKKQVIDSTGLIDSVKVPVPYATEVFIKSSPEVKFHDYSVNGKEIRFGKIETCVLDSNQIRVFFYPYQESNDYGIDKWGYVDLNIEYFYKGCKADRKITFLTKGNHLDKNPPILF